MSFSKLLCKVEDIHPVEGELKGKCCICGAETEHGHKKKFGGNFTCADYLGEGTVFCPECYYLVKNSNTYRRTMFLLTEDELVKFKKKEAKNIIFNLPDKPFYIYLTKTWQKTGWIRMNEVYNTGNKGIINFLVDYDIVRTDIETLKDTCKFIGELRSLKIPKTILENGHLEIFHFQKIIEAYGNQNSRRIINKIYEAVHNPVWELALYLEE